MILMMMTDDGQKEVPDMGTDKLNTTTDTEIVEDYDEDFLGYVVDNDDDDSESRGVFIKEILLGLLTRKMVEKRRTPFFSFCVNCYVSMIYMHSVISFYSCSS